MPNFEKHFFTPSAEDVNVTEEPLIKHSPPVKGCAQLHAVRTFFKDTDEDLITLDDVRILQGYRERTAETSAEN